MKAAKPTNMEIADLSKLLAAMQELVEKDGYQPEVVLNVTINMAARYAAVSKVGEKAFRKIATAAFKTQKRVVEEHERKLEQERRAGAS
jgi:hypothetical protein